MRDKDYAAHPRDILSDSRWAALLPLLPPGCHKKTTWSFLEAILFRARTGCAWRDLPERFGPWSTASTRFQTWTRNGWFEALRKGVLRANAPDLSEAFLDSTSCKLLPCAHGSKKKSSKPSGARAEARTPK